MRCMCKDFAAAPQAFQSTRVNRRVRYTHLVGVAESFTHIHAQKERKNNPINKSNPHTGCARDRKRGHLKINSHRELYRLCVCMCSFLVSSPSPIYLCGMRIREVLVAQSAAPSVPNTLINIATSHTHITTKCNYSKYLKVFF